MPQTKLPGSQVLDQTIKNADIATDAGIEISKLAPTASTIVGAKASGGTVALTPTEVRSLINVSDGATPGVTLVSPPEHYNSIGTAGQLAYDNDYLYICVSTNLWIRFTGIKNF